MGSRPSLCLPCELGADPAGIGEAVDELAVDALVQADARADLVGPPLAGLQGELGIGHGGAGDGDHIGLAGLDDGSGVTMAR